MSSMGSSRQRAAKAERLDIRRHHPPDRIEVVTNAATFHSGPTTEWVDLECTGREEHRAQSTG